MFELGVQCNFLFVNLVFLWPFSLIHLCAYSRLMSQEKLRWKYRIQPVCRTLQIEVAEACAWVIYTQFRFLVKKYICNGFFNFNLRLSPLQ